jgi:uncharacterized protein
MEGKADVQSGILCQRTFSTFSGNEAAEMKIFITGGTGFVGRGLTQGLIDAGHEVTLLTRSLRKFGSHPPQIFLVEGNPAQKGVWQKYVGENEAVVNLAGASIFSRWSEKKKRALRESRILTTRNLVEAFRGGRVRTFFSTSAIGYYGFHEDEELTESSPPGTDFLARLAADWEKEALQAEELGIRVVLTRFGIVLGEEGGAMGQMIPMFRKFLGGPLGNGNQWFSWIHRADLTRAVSFLLERAEISGPVNFTAPNPVRNRDLAAAIGKTLNRPASFPTPGLMLRLVLGEFGSVLLKGQKVIPEKLTRAGFQFRYPRIEEALAEILKK